MNYIINIEVILWLIAIIAVEHLFLFYLKKQKEKADREEYFKQNPHLLPPEHFNCRCIYVGDYFNGGIKDG